MTTQGDTASVSELFEELGARTGCEALVADTVDMARATARIGLLTDVTLSAEDAVPFIEGVLRYHGFVLSVDVGREPQVLVLHEEDADLEAVTFVACSLGDLKEIVRHPAVLVELSVPVRRLDVRRLAMQLRVLCRPGPYGVSLDSAGQLVLRGPGHDVGTWARLVMQSDGGTGMVEVARVKPRVEARPPTRLTSGGGEAGPTLLGLLQTVAVTLRAQFCATEDVRKALSETFSGLLVDVDIPEGRFLGVAQAILLGQGFVLEQVHDSSPRLLGVHSHHASRRRWSTHSPIAVSAVQDDYEGEAALLAFGVLRLSRNDPQEVAAVMRHLFRDMNRQHMVIAGDHFVIGGVGADVRESFGLLRALESDTGVVPGWQSPFLGQYPGPPLAEGLGHPWSGATLLDLLRDYGRLTGTGVCLSRQAREALDTIAVELDGFEGTDIFQEVAERCLKEAGLSLILLHSDPPIVGVYSPALAGVAAGIFHHGQLSDLENAARHPALLVRTVVPLERLDAKVVVSVMRPMMRDTRTQAVAVQSRVIVGGAGEEVARWAALIRESDLCGELVPELREFRGR